MSKITLSTIGSITQNPISAQTALNDNFSIIQSAVDNTLSRDGTLPNQMGNNLDMNSNQILNLPAPATANSPVRLQDVNSTVPITVPPVGTSGAVVGLLNTNKTDSGNNTFTGSNTFTNTVTFPNNSVSNASLSQASANTLKGNNTNSTANVTDLSQIQVQTLLSIWANRSSTVTTNYTVQNTDNATTLILGGGHCFTVTLNAPATYSGNTFVVLNNLDSRGKTISCSGLSSFILWPNQTAAVYIVNGNWTVNRPIRWKLPASLGTLTVFVDGTNGSDSNDGLSSGSGNAFQSIQKGIDTVANEFDINGINIVVQVADGTYTTPLHLYTVTGWRTIGGHNELCLRGNLSTPSNCVISTSTNNCFSMVGLYTPWSIEGFRLICSGTANGISCDGRSFCYFRTVDFNTCGNAHLSSSYGSFLEATGNYSVSGGAAYHMNAFGQALLTNSGWTATISSTPSFSSQFVASLEGSVVSLQGAVWSGAATGSRYLANGNSLVDTGTGSTTTLPGNSAGSVSLGGTYN